MFYLSGIKLNPVDIDRALKIVIDSISKKNGDYFCFSNIHLVMEGIRHYEIREAVNNSTANFPDGMGVVWALKILGNKFNDRVRGADFMLKLCEYAYKTGLKIFLFGNTEETLETLKKKLKSIYPTIEIAGSISPPFRPLSKEEDEDYIKKINESGADILFVSLGAPKQEKWMYEHKGKIEAVQLGVGAAFSFITGKVKQAPVWMQKSGLEWLYRLPQEPKKTIYRMSLVPEFLIRLLIQLITHQT